MSEDNINPVDEDINEQEYAPVLYKFSNNNSPHLDTILAMFYQGITMNAVGIMDAFNLTTEQEETILVGVQLDEEGKPECFPLARVLRAEDVRNYLSPDGKGGYFDPLNPTEVAEAKENMKSFHDAVSEPVSVEE